MKEKQSTFSIPNLDQLNRRLVTTGPVYGNERVLLGGVGRGVGCLYLCPVGGLIATLQPEFCAA